jgi:ubiquitin-protein ligase
MTANLTPAAQKLRASHLRSRVLVDLVELREQPLPGFSVHFDDADTSKVCLVVEPAEGHLEKLKLHFDVEVPAEFPLVPVKVANSTPLNHPNGSSPCLSLSHSMLSPGLVFGNWICLDILKDEDEMRYYRSATYNVGDFTIGSCAVLTLSQGGFTPGYSLQGIFHQVASFFGTDK